ncbi:Dicer RNAse [Candida orthopsilosis Co 90-125]|uniref:ribonuclease III n=1 Tax=Candida orthopsilosis (strain 90-125) TaxID=1136231 RepID=H8X7B3_CANO9|nr:Dicer RNAse [Candida orthopsilosis Co 90-125]CCG24042.1 Dicer RNAse [Candida orthopsilosis Co 90-125]
MLIIFKLPTLFHPSIRHHPIPSYPKYTHSQSNMDDPLLSGFLQNVQAGEHRRNESSQHQHQHHHQHGHNHVHGNSKSGPVLKKRRASNDGYQSQIMSSDLAFKKHKSVPKETVNGERRDEPKFDAQPPKSIGFLDLQRIEHATKSLQKNAKVILSQAPDANQLKELLNSREIDSATRSDLKQSDLMALASRLKTKHILGDAPILDQVINETLILTEEDKEKLTKLVGEQGVNQSQLALARVVVNDIAPNGVEHTLPNLPIIDDVHLYERVFTHKSNVNNKTYLNDRNLINSHNERLEFLGDSVLNNLVTLIIYEKFPVSSEGVMSQIRADLINNKVLRDFALQYGFDQKLRSNVSKDSLQLGDQKAYADVFEAYIGALSLERGLDLTEVRRWLEQLYKPLLAQAEKKYITEFLDKEAKTELYALIGRADARPEYVTVVEGDGLENKFVVECRMGDEVLGKGEDRNAKNAGLRSAMNALKNSAALERYVIERQSVERPIKESRAERLKEKKAEKMRKLREQEEAGEKQVEEAPGCPDSPIRTSMFPLEVLDDVEVDGDAKNKLYATLGVNTGTKPEYIVKESKNGQHTVQLLARKLIVATATDKSKKKATARVADAVMKDPEALRELCKRFD